MDGGDGQRALTGASQWARGNQPQYSANGFVAQLPPFAGSFDLITENSANNTGTGTNGDVDRGKTSTRSVAYTIPAAATSASASFQWFIGASGSGLTGDDYFRLHLVNDSNDTIVQTLMQSIPTGGANASWTAANVDVSSHAGSTVYLLAEAGDIGVTGSIIEAGLDDVLVIAELPDPPAATEISGNVFRDYGADGARSSGEPGVAGVTVTAFRSDGTTVSPTATSASDGSYTLIGLVDTTDYRIEFSGLPSELNPGAVGSDSASTVRFVTSPALGSDLALQDTTDFSQANPYLAVTCYINGNRIVWVTKRWWRRLNHLARPS